MKLIRIEQDYVEVTWPHAKDFIKKALDISRGERDLDDIYLSLLHNQMPVSYTHLTLPTTPYV